MARLRRRPDRVTNFRCVRHTIESVPPLLGRVTTVLMVGPLWYRVQQLKKSRFTRSFHVRVSDTFRTLVVSGLANPRPGPVARPCVAGPRTSPMAGPTVRDLAGPSYLAVPTYVAGRAGPTGPTYMVYGGRGTDQIANGTTGRLAAELRHPHEPPSAVEHGSPPAHSSQRSASSSTTPRRPAAAGIVATWGYTAARRQPTPPRRTSDGHRGWPTTGASATAVIETTPRRPSANVEVKLSTFDGNNCLETFLANLRNFASYYKWSMDRGRRTLPHSSLS